MAQQYKITQEDVAFIRRLALNSDNPINLFIAAEAEKRFTQSRHRFENSEQPKQVKK